MSSPSLLGRRVLIAIFGVFHSMVLVGCSSDGGFFPGTINHNEGAVDYRVAPIHVSTAEAAHIDVRTGYVSLGWEGTAPYVPLNEAGPIRSFSRTKTPQVILDAESARDEAYKARLEAEDKLRGLERESKEMRLQNSTDAQNDLAEAQDEQSSANVAQNRFERGDSAVSASDRKLYKDWAAGRQAFEDAKKALEAFNTAAATPDAPENKLSAIDKDAQRASLMTAYETAKPPIDAYQIRLKELDDAVATADKKVNDAKREVENRAGELKVDAAPDQNIVAARADFEAKKKTEADSRATLERQLQDQKEGNFVSEGRVQRVESLRLTLKQAYFREFAEPGPVCEVAVLMTVKESRSGLTQQEPKAGRVVYYSEGARKNAFMNFRDQPVYGPIRYGGDDLQIRISVIELDEGDNAIAGAMLKTLATIGSIAYPPSSPVLSALDQIGEALLTLNGPDLELDYAMRLSSRPPEAIGNVERAAWDASFDAWIRDGYYVLVRSDTAYEPELRRRINPMEWSNLWLDPRTGVIFVKSDDGSYIEYAERSYLVLAVQTGFDSSQLDLAQEAADLGSIVNAYGSGVDGLGGATKSMADAMRQSIDELQERKRQKQRERNRK